MCVCIDINIHMNRKRIINYYISTYSGPFHEGRVLANGLGNRGLISGQVIPKTQKIVLDASLLNTQYYKVRIKVKMNQSSERISTQPYSSMKLVLKREPSGHPQLRSPSLLISLQILII